MKSILPTRAPIIIAVITVLFLSILIFISNSGRMITANILPLMRASISVGYHISMFHNGIDELEMKAPAVSKKSVLKHLADAKMYAAIMLAGGRSPEGYILFPIREKNLREITQDMVGNLEKLSRMHFDSGWSGGHTDIHEKFYQSLGHILNDIKKIELAIKKDVSRQLRRFRILGYAMGFLVVLSGILAIFYLFRDKGGKETAANTQAENEERNKNIVGVSLDAIITIDNEENVVEFNPSAVEMFGYTEDQVKGQDIAKLIIPHRLREKHRRSFKRYLETGEKTIIGKRLEISAIRSDGKEFPIELAVTEIRMRGRQYFTAFIGDLTERKQAEDDLKSQEELFHSIAASAQDAIVMMDDNGDTVFINEAAEIMFGYDRGELIGRPLHKTIVPRRYYDDLSRGFEKFRETGQGELIGKVVELPVVRKDGLEFFADHSFSAVKIRNKWHAVAVIRDNTERRKFEDELKKAKDEAENASHYKSEFLAAMSHDLRTPLNAIMGFSEMMGSHTFGPLGNPHYDEYAKDIHTSGKLLVSLINGILDISKIEAGKYELTEEPMEIKPLIDNSIKLITRHAEIKNIRITTDIEPGLPMIYADDRAMSQIINNFLSNAIKFTPVEGKISLSASIKNDRSIIIRVADSGIGMSDDDILKAIRPFEQVDSSRSRKHQGTGLGLYICSNLMKLHGGSMEINSEKGLGTTVTVRFPPERTVGV